MSFLAILAAATTVAWLFGRRTGTTRDHARRGLALATVIAGVSHFANPDPFVQHLPEWVPGREPLIYLTGVIEVLFGLALIGRTTARRTVGRLLAIYFIAVFPANVYVAVADVAVTGQVGGVAAWIRLPLQALFIGWALWSTAIPSSTALSPAEPGRSSGPDALSSTTLAASR